MKKLISILKVVYENFHVLHRNVNGLVWFGDHETLAGYYEKIEEMKDDTIEIAIALGHQEPGLAEAVENYTPINGYKEYTGTEAFQLAQKYFKDVHAAYEEILKEVPHDVLAKFEEYQYWLRKEADYKLAKRLSK
jgi:DNA-binding ferritin-like protein